MCGGSTLVGPELAKRAINDLLDQLRVLDERIDGYDREIEAQAKLSDAARRLMQIRGIGPTTALAIVATLTCETCLYRGRARS